MTYSWLDAIKDSLGAASPVLISVPWFNDFQLRRRIAALRRLPSSGQFSELKQEIEARVREKLEAPKFNDIVWTVVGLAFMLASFSIGFVQGIKELLSK